MSNPFSINVVTPAGAALIAQATATNQIVFIGAKTATTAAVDAADLALKTLSFYDGAIGTIDGCSATASVAKIVAKFGNTGGAAQIVKSVCIVGKLASQSDTDAVIVAAMSDANSEVTLPSSASPSQIIRFPFNININVSGSVSTVYSDGATLSDLQRFVSMHKAGDPTTGENQTILGEKTFFSASWLAESGMDATEFCKISNRSTTNGMRTAIEFPDYTGYAPKIILYSNSGSGEYSESVIQSDKLTINTNSNSNSHGVSVSGDVYVDGDVSVDGALSTTGNATIGGALSTTGVASVGGLSGIAMSGSGRKTIPIGGMIPVCPSGVAGWDSSKVPGDTITVVSGTLLPIAEWNCDNTRFDQSVYTIDNGSYMLLNGWNYGTGTNTYGVVFLLRIS